MYIHEKNKRLWATQLPLAPVIRNDYPPPPPPPPPKKKKKKYTPNKQNKL